MEESTVIRILIADDHFIIREGLVGLIEAQPGFQVVGEACNGKEAVALYEKLLPDVTVMDLRMPQMSGLEAIEEIINRHPTASIVVLTTYATDEAIYRAMKAGAKAFLRKDTSSQELNEAIRQAASKKSYITSEIAAAQTARLTSLELTPREKDVLNEMAAGKSNLEIANHLFISEGTVKSHVNTILNKMNVKDRTQAVVKAIKQGIVVLEESKPNVN